MNTFRGVDIRYGLEHGLGLGLGVEDRVKVRVRVTVGFESYSSCLDDYSAGDSV